MIDEYGAAEDGDELEYIGKLLDLLEAAEAYVASFEPEFLLAAIEERNRLGALAAAVRACR